MVRILWAKKKQRWVWLSLAPTFREKVYEALNCAFTCLWGSRPRFHGGPPTPG